MGLLFAGRKSGYDAMEVGSVSWKVNWKVNLKLLQNELWRSVGLASSEGRPNDMPVLIAQTARIV